MRTPNELAPRVVPFGERAYVVELGDVIDIDVNQRVHALAARISARRDELRVGPPVPAYASLLVEFDASPSDVEGLRAELQLMADGLAHSPDLDGELVEIPVRYGGEAGPDLDEVAQRTGLSVAEVVERHTGTEYRVFMLGFAPGFAYLGSVPEVLRLPRRDDPRLRVPAGSVAIAAAQTAVYPHTTAGGWHLLGRTEVTLWDPTAADPSRLKPGDRVRFVAS